MSNNALKDNTYLQMHEDGSEWCYLDENQTHPVYVYYTVTVKAPAPEPEEPEEPEEPDTPVANESTDVARPSVYAQNGLIHVTNAPGEVEVYSVTGQSIYKGTASEIPVSTAGVYIVSVGNYRIKVLVR